MEKRMQGGFDVLRIVLAFSVVMMHTTPNTGSDFAESTLRHMLACSAAPMFFCMAGYFLFLKVSSQPPVDAAGRARVRKYTARIAKVCLVWLPLYLIIVGNRVTLDWLKSLVQDPLRGIANASLATGVLWYLVALLVAVALQGLLMRFMRRRTIFILMLLLYIPLLLSESYQFLLKTPFFQQLLWGLPSRALLAFDLHFLFGLPFFSLGAWIAEADAQTPPDPSAKPRKGDFVGLALSLLFLFGESLLRYQFALEKAKILILLPAVCFFLMRVLARTWTKERAIYPFLRSASALVYYIHGFLVPFRYYLFDLNVHTSAFFKIPMMETVFIFSLSFFLAWAILRLERHPKFRWLKKIH